MSVSLEDCERCGAMLCEKPCAFSEVVRENQQRVDYIKMRDQAGFGGIISSPCLGRIMSGFNKHDRAITENGVIGGKDEWLTPPYIINALAPFDLDPCAPVERPWETALNYFTRYDNGLNQRWEGRVWCNPPYGNNADHWLARMADHQNGIALVFARTETKMFFDHVWSRAHAILFIEGRLAFYNVAGNIAASSAGAPSVLIAYSKNDADILSAANMNGSIKGKQLWITQNSVAA